MPPELNVIAPMAHPDSSRRYCSGISWQYSLSRSGIVPFWHVWQCVSSVGCRICKRSNRNNNKNQQKYFASANTSHSTLCTCIGFETDKMGQNTQDNATKENKKKYGVKGEALERKR